MNQNPGDIQQSLLSSSEAKPLRQSFNPTELINNKSFHRAMKVVVFILIMIGLMIGKLWITVPVFRYKFNRL